MLFLQEILTLIRYYTFAQLCISHIYMSNLPKDKLARFQQLLLPWQHTSPHISANTNKYNSLCEWARHTKLRLCTAKTVEIFWCFNNKPPVCKLFKFYLIIPFDSNTKRRLHYFASHNMQWTCLNFCTFAYKSSGSSVSGCSARSAAHSSASLTQR